MNKIQGSLRLSQTGPSAPRLLISSALMGAEGSVTLQLRETNAPVSDSNASKARRDENNSKFETVDNDNRPPFTSESSLKAGGSVTTMINNSESVSNVLDTVGLNASHLSKKTSIVVATQQPLTMTTLAATNTQTTSSLNSSTIVKKQRPKTLSPTRHGGPQQCQVCSKVFGNASALAKHKLTHSDERKYVCGMCSKAFKRQDHLNGHMLTHRNKKPYECKADGCGKSYCDARSLRRHTENHHSSLVLTTSSQVQSNSTTSNGTSTSTITNPSSSTSDVSSPNGATCIQYQMNCDGNTITTINAKSPTASPTGINNEGLTRQQLNLISQIMQQSKQASGQKTTAQRPRTWNMQTQLQLNIPKLTQNQESPKNSQPATPNNNQSNGLKLEQKPVECNLCHRKFKNIPALNGHMRLHGGYFKKENETKKSDKKDYSGPPLQTASVGVRALIEEKIINKRSKDLKGAFAIPAAPLSATRRLAEADGFLNIKNVNAISNSRNNTITIVASGVSTNSLNGLTKQSILQQVFPQTPTTCQIQKTQSSQLSTEKDATLIELLKRGTKVAVKRENSDQGQLRLLQATTRVLMPASSISSPEVSAPSLVLSNGASSPLSLTISQASISSESSGIYTLAYSTSNSSSFLNNEGRNVNDTAMLLQAVDSIQLLQDHSPSDQLDDMDSLGEYTSLSETQSFAPSLQLQAVLDSPLPDSLVEFGSLNSKDYMLYGCSSNESPTTSTSPLSSPLAYPTPPASHETSAQVSPFLNDSHNFSDANTFFHEDEKTKTMMLDDSSEFLSKNDGNLTENERILQLKNELLNDSKSVLEDTSFFHINKSILDEHDLFKSDNSFLSSNSKSFIDDNNAKLQDFNQNLDFLDEAQAFDMDDDRNSSSPLSAAFFSATMSTAEEVKEALDEILPNEDDDATETLDLYFLSGHSLQSQMMSNSDDPLLSSIPRDFSSQRYPNMSPIVTQNQTILHTTQSFDIDPFSPPEQKKIKTENCENSEKNILSVQTDHASDISSVFMSPTSISSSSPQLQCALLTQAKKKNSQTPNELTKRQELFKSDMKNSPQLHYTPSPMLNPKRSGTGLFKITCRDKLSDIDDGMNVIDLFEKPRVNIGSDYQAMLPFENDFFYEDDKSFETLLWKPNVLKDERQLDRFVELAKSSAVSLHSIDSALKILLENRGEIHVAILKLLQNPENDSEKSWNQFEIEQFLKGLEMYGKDFTRVAQDIVKKTTGDCVQLYYSWKKLCSEYKSTHLPPNRDCISTDHNKDNNKTAKCDNNFFDYNNSSNLTIQNGNNNGQINSTAAANHNSELRPHVCEVPDCSASFSSRVALHGHTRIHCIGRSVNQSTIGNLLNSSTQPGASIKDLDFPCKVCGKVFNKVKSRSAHMKSHRPQENEHQSLSS